jgi:hypothetical protein
VREHEPAAVDPRRHRYVSEVTHERAVELEHLNVGRPRRRIAEAPAPLGEGAVPLEDPLEHRLECLFVTGPVGPYLGFHRLSCCCKEP